MSEIARKAGQPYPQVAQRQFLGSGITRSCGRCLRFRSQGNGAVLKRWGWVCSDCKGSKA